jgi:hypothetical protein
MPPEAQRFFILFGALVGIPVLAAMSLQKKLWRNRIDVPAGARRPCYWTPADVDFRNYSVEGKRWLRISLALAGITVVNYLLLCFNVFIYII